jgi:hypothetical protein
MPDLFLTETLSAAHAQPRPIHALRATRQQRIHYDQMAPPARHRTTQRHDPHHDTCHRALRLSWRPHAPIAS